MNWLRNGARKIVGLFVDDPTLAIGVAVWIAVIALIGSSPALATTRPYAFALGLCAILLLSIVRGAVSTK